MNLSVPSPKRRGFSLIEVNMAILLLAGGLLALLGLFPLGLRESLASRNEMRLAAFAERLLGAARIAAEDPNVTSVSELASALRSDFTINASPGKADTNKATKDSESGVYYYAWIEKDETYTSGSLGKKEMAQIGIQVTAEDATQNKYALRSAPTYTAWVLLDAKNGGN